MQTQFVQPSDVGRIRKSVDPDEKWFTDAEISKIMQVSGCELNKIVVRCFLGIEQKARVKKDNASVRWARHQLTLYEIGYLQIQ